MTRWPLALALLLSACAGDGDRTEPELTPAQAAEKKQDAMSRVRDEIGYKERLETKVVSHQKMPRNCAKRTKAEPCAAQIAVVLDAQGNVSQVAIMKSSGDKRFDAQALKAVRAAAPFSPPPSTLAGQVIGLKVSTR